MRKMKEIIFFLTLIFSVNLFADNKYNLTSNGILENGVSRVESTLDIGSIASVGYTQNSDSFSYSLTIKNSLTQILGTESINIDSNVAYSINPSVSTSVALSFTTTPKYTVYLNDGTKIDYTLELTYKNYLGRSYTDFLNIFPKVSVEMGSITIDSKLGARTYLKDAEGLYRLDGEFELSVGKSLSDRIYVGLGNYTLFVQDNKVIRNYDIPLSDGTIIKGQYTDYLVSVDDACDEGMEMLYQYLWMSLYTQENISLTALAGNSNYYVISTPEKIYGSAYVSTTYTHKLIGYLDEVGVNIKYTEEYTKKEYSNYYKIYLKKSF